MLILHCYCLHFLYVHGKNSPQFNVLCLVSRSEHEDSFYWNTLGGPAFCHLEYTQTKVLLDCPLLRGWSSFRVSIIRHSTVDCFIYKLLRWSKNDQAKSGPNSVYPPKAPKNDLSKLYLFYSTYRTSTAQHIHTIWGSALLQPFKNTKNPQWGKQSSRENVHRSSDTQLSMCPLHLPVRNI